MSHRSCISNASEENKRSLLFLTDSRALYTNQAEDNYGNSKAFALQAEALNTSEAPVGLDAAFMIYCTVNTQVILMIVLYIVHIRPVKSEQG